MILFCLSSAALLAALKHCLSSGLQTFWVEADFQMTRMLLGNEKEAWEEKSCAVLPLCLKCFCFIGFRHMWFPDQSQCLAPVTNTTPLFLKKKSSLQNGEKERIAYLQLGYLIRPQYLGVPLSWFRTVLQLVGRRKEKKYLKYIEIYVED